MYYQNVFTLQVKRLIVFVSCLGLSWLHEIEASTTLTLNISRTKRTFTMKWETSSIVLKVLSFSLKVWIGNLSPGVITFYSGSPQNSGYSKPKKNKKQQNKNIKKQNGDKKTNQ